MLMVISLPVKTFADPAQGKVTCNNGETVTVTRTGSVFTPEDYRRACGAKGYTDTSQESFTFKANPAGECNGSCIKDDVQLFINVLTIGFGVIAVGMIIVGGLQYITSRDNPQLVQAAKKKILNAIVAILAFGFVWAFLQWLVPGGVFN